MYKDWLKYQQGNECGLKFKHKWIDKIYDDKQTEAQALGWWFEDMGIRGESSIQPPLLKTGGFNVAYRNMEKQLVTLKAMLRSAGEILSSNEDAVKGRVKGKRDLVVKKGDEIVIIDIKTSAHVKNKYDFYGWGALTEPQGEKSFRFNNQIGDKLIQAYTYLYIDTDFKADAFEWWIFSTTDEEVLRLRIEAKNHRDAIREIGDDLEDALDYINEEDFIPYPDYKRCKYCPLQNTCQYREKLPTAILL